MDSDVDTTIQPNQLGKETKVFTTIDMSLNNTTDEAARPAVSSVDPAKEL